jgi:predicted dehydrogenase
LSGPKPIRLGVIGCGGFGLFALQQFAQTPGVELAGMAGTHRPAAEAAAKRFGLPDIVEVERLVAEPSIDLVYVATPPFLHHQQALLALRAGKHVICEKPLALRIAEADEMVAEARVRDRLMVANLMQRYNPLYETVRKLIDSQVLGEVLHGYFENYASDENLPPEHWFWDLEKSGGIFIEHGVHFFDLFAGWLGEGVVAAAQRSCRPGTGLEDQVQCTVRYGESTLVNFYHGFHQPSRLDRQEIRLVFERGDVSLFDWVPTRLRLRAIADEEATRELCELLPQASLDVVACYGGGERSCRGRGKPLDVYQSVEIRWGDGRGKLPVYCQLLRAMMEDQTAWIHDRQHQRKVTEDNGRQSLALACDAHRLARSSFAQNAGG